MLKKIIKKYLLRSKIIKKLSIATIINENLIHQIITNIQNEKLRSALFYLHQFMDHKTIKTFLRYFLIK